LQQGVDASAEETGVYDSTFKPKTVGAKENVFKSAAVDKTEFVSVEAGVRILPCFNGTSYMYF